MTHKLVGLRISEIEFQIPKLTRIVHQDIQPAEMLEDLVEYVRVLLKVGHVKGQNENVLVVQLTVDDYEIERWLALLI